jgi:hypothetical protein
LRIVGQLGGGGLRRGVAGVVVVLCLLLALGGSAATRLASAQTAARGNSSRFAPAGLAGVDFAIADFDGDSLPDVATVQVGPEMASRTKYSIRFEFSARGRQSFVVSGPTGGLQISSRDVNGDSFLDLIISTRLANEPVAVLLNDGAGNFRLMDVRGFAAAIWESAQEWSAKAGIFGESGNAMASAGWVGGWCAVAARGGLPSGKRVTATGTEGLGSFTLLREIRGRAPPAG